MMDVADDSMALSRSFNRIKENPAGWVEGDVMTTHGIVSVYAQGDIMRDHYTRLDFVMDGRLYMRRFDKRFTQRGLMAKATQFAAEIAQLHERTDQ